VSIAGTIGVGKTCTATNINKYLNNESNLPEINNKYPNLKKFYGKAHMSLEAPDSRILKRFYKAFIELPEIFTLRRVLIIMGLWGVSCLILGGFAATLLLITALYSINLVMQALKGPLITPKDVCFDTQMYFLCKRKKNTRKALNLDGLIINDRSWLEDELFPKMQFHLGQITATQFAIYNTFFEEYSYEMPYPDIWIYLKASSKRTFDNVQKRIAERKTDGISTFGEELITLQYLDALVNRYDKWELEMKKKFGNRFIIIDCEMNHKSLDVYLTILNKRL